MDKLDITYEVVTPQMASEYLQKTTGRQRPISPAHVRVLADAMVKGGWGTNGDAIRFNELGELIDGHHRLKACTVAGLPFKTLVMRGLPMDAYGTIDLGRRRGARDMLRWDGVSHSAEKASIVAAAMRISYRCGLEDVRRNTQVNAETLEWLVDSVYLRVKGKMKTPPSLICGAMLSLKWRIGDACKDSKAEFPAKAYRAFCEGVVEGAGLPSGHPMLLLRDVLFTASHGKKLVTGSTFERARNVAALVFSAWNASRKGKSLARLQINKTDEKGNYVLPKVKP